jgi:hypothetical protein
MGPVKPSSQRFVSLALLLAPVIFGTGGCVMMRDTLNEPIAADKLAGLAPGQTTASEAAALLGAPNEVVQLARRSAWRYDYLVRKRAGLVLIVVNLVGVDTHMDRAWLFFDENDVLTHVGATLEADRAEYVMPWSALDH